MRDKGKRECMWSVHEGEREFENVKATTSSHQGVFHEYFSPSSSMGVTRVVLAYRPSQTLLLVFVSPPYRASTLIPRRTWLSSYSLVVLQDFLKEQSSHTSAWCLVQKCCEYFSIGRPFYELRNLLYALYVTPSQISYFIYYTICY